MQICVVQIQIMEPPWCSWDLIRGVFKCVHKTTLSNACLAYLGQVHACVCKPHKFPHDNHLHCICKVILSKSFQCQSPSITYINAVYPSARRCTVAIKRFPPLGKLMFSPHWMMVMYFSDIIFKIYNLQKNAPVCKRENLALQSNSNSNIKKTDPVCAPLTTATALRQLCCICPIPDISFFS